MPTTKFIKERNLPITGNSSLPNDNTMMNEYIFTNERGWRVHEYRPFSLSYAVLQTPCLSRYSVPACYGMGRPIDRDAGEPELPAESPSLLESLISQQLKFSYFSKDVLRQLLEERVNIRDRNRSSILGHLSDVSGEIYGASVLRTPDADKRKQNLEKTRLDLERQLREEDVTLWRDSLELRRELILADKAYTGTQFRQELMTTFPPLDDNKRQGDTALSG